MTASVTWKNFVVGQSIWQLLCEKYFRFVKDWNEKNDINFFHGKVEIVFTSYSKSAHFSFSFKGVTMASVERLSLQTYSSSVTLGSGEIP